ncbi:MAG: succinylglutamate desuccinylase/aspartoacylase family protein [Pseudobacteriovorax sp.]|nr:succinylglutamate desuccinylase/aspartoacylase family protein [Pseudobacteriovorax sp.]
MNVPYGKTILGLICLSLNLGGTRAAPTEGLDPLVSSWEVTTVDEDLLKTIASGFEIVSRQNDTYQFYGFYDERERVKAFCPQCKIVQVDIHQGLSSIAETNAYHSFEDIEKKLFDWQNRYSEIAMVDEYGLSGRDRGLYALVLTAPGPSLQKKEVMLTAATHGDELITTEVLLRLTEEILEGFGNDDRLTRFLENTRVHVIPVVSPDGFARRARYVGRVDPNRNFPRPNGNDIASIPAIAGLRDYVADNNIVGSIDFHAFSQLLMYPWAYTRDRLDPIEEAAYVDLGQKMVLDNDYRLGQVSRILYPARGSSADYWHWKHGTLAWAAELATSKVPRAERIPEVVDEAREMTWVFLEAFAPVL